MQTGVQTQQGPLRPPTGDPHHLKLSYIYRTVGKLGLAFVAMSMGLYKA